MGRGIRVPKYRLHKPSGRAVVTLGGRDVYLGEHGTRESRRAYDRAVAEWLAGGRAGRSKDEPTVGELIDGFLREMEGRYKSNEPWLMAAALGVVRSLYGDVPATAFGPAALKVVRGRFVAAGLVRAQCNKRTRIIVRAFRWGVAEGLIPSTTWEALRAVETIRRGTPGTVESTPVKPVADWAVEAVLPFVSRQVAAMIRIQHLTGMRPGEVCVMRTGDVDRTGAVWEYRPREHKTEHLGRDRVVFIGPAAQTVLRPWLRADPGAWLFQPGEAEAERLEALRAARRSKVQPSQVSRRGPTPRTYRDHYTTASYRQAVGRGIAKANAARRRDDPGAAPVPAWTPHQLRHSAATAIRREFGLDVARAVLGHSSAGVTAVYAELDEAKARETMARIG